MGLELNYALGTLRTSREFSAMLSRVPALL